VLAGWVATVTAKLAPAASASAISVDKSQELRRRNRERVSLLKPAADAQEASLRPLLRAATVSESNSPPSSVVDVDINRSLQQLT
jgi:methylphosphotriester-DNA--protein-cysteine methyltransferase